MKDENVLHAYVGAFVDELARAGVQHVCFSPGSRSTPLLLMLAQHGAFTLWTHIDERSAAFFAYGLAKERNEPVALLCSSGTAAANFYPAVIEAFYERVPLVVLTADRPHTLRETGAPQTIQQVHLYGDHVKWFVDMAPARADTKSLRYARSIAARAVAMARRSPAGPVHMNFPFDEPLIPRPGSEQIDSVHEAMESPRPATTAYHTVLQQEDSLSSDDIERLIDDIRGWRRGIIVCGPQRDPVFPEHVTALADKTGYPILADPLSGVRHGWHEKTWVVEAYDALLRDTQFAEAMEPDVILRFGSAPTSKALTQYMDKHARARHIVVDEGHGWRDPDRLAHYYVHASPRTLCTQLVRHMPADLQHADRTWGNMWQQANATAKQAIERRIAQFDTLFEGSLFHTLRTLLPRRTRLIVGNSMPVRDLDSFMFCRTDPLACYANRGANGIDGVVSTALGMKAATERPVVLVLGDLSFYHDLNGLLAAKQHNLDITIIVINNDGGGIFSFLPQADVDGFEKLFATPHGLQFAPAVHMYGGKHTTITSLKAFCQVIPEAIKQGGLQVIEVQTDRLANKNMHDDVWQAVADELSSCTGE